MALFSQYGETESKFVRVGDSSFRGMNYRTSPDKLPEGVVSYAENIRMRSGEAETRPGNPYIGWFYPENYPYDEEYANGGVALAGTWTTKILLVVSGASGAFTNGETLTGSSSGATGTWVTGGTVTLNGTGFLIGETVTGGTSTNTATVASYTWTGDDADVTVTTGTTSGTPFADGYTYLRFSSGLILEVTAEESGGTITVEPQFIHAGQSVTAETFVWCKRIIGDANIRKDLTRGVINDAGQTPVTCGSFTDPNGVEYAVIVTESSAWFGSEYNRPFEVSIPGGIDDTAYLVQAFDRLFLFRGTGQSVLQYTTATGAWAEPTSATDATYTLPLPNADRATFFQNRMWVHVEDRVYFSDIGNPDRYYWLENELRINEGESDDIVAVFPFGKYSLLIFKENSIHLLDNLYGDVAENMRVRIISSRIGCGAPNTITNVGSDVWFCDISGDVWAISQVDEERTELMGEPVSWPIRPYLEEIGIRNIDTWFGAYHDAYFYLFFDTDYKGWVPNSVTTDYPDYDDLNRIAVYDTINKAWVSIDWDSGLNAIGKPMYLNYLQDKRLMIVDKATGHLRVIGYGMLDGTRKTSVSNTYRVAYFGGDPFATVMTRGYHAERGADQQCKQVKIQMGRYSSSFTVDLLKDGIGEETEILNINRASTDRLEYMNANEYTGYTDWDPTNVNGDFENPYRKDYAVYPDDDSTGISFDASGGIRTNLFQTYKYAKRVNERGNYFQVKVSCDVGQMKLKDVSIAVRGDGNFHGERV